MAVCANVQNNKENKWAGKGTISLTGGDGVENHKGMQIIYGPNGQAERGFFVYELDDARRIFEEQGYEAEVHRLDDRFREDEASLKAMRWSKYSLEDLEAGLLIVRNGVNAILNYIPDGTDTLNYIQYTADDLWNEHCNTDIMDKHALMYGQVRNKHCRWNYTCTPEAQEPNYAEGKGRCRSLKELPVLSRFRKNIPFFMGPVSEGFNFELNYYADGSIDGFNGIGYHGDCERKPVVCARLGETVDLYHRWYHEGERMEFEPYVWTLNHGDFYVMSTKAGGGDWHTRKIPTLRHAAGAYKFIK